RARSRCWTARIIRHGGSTALLPPSPPSLRSGSRARSEIEGHFTGMGIAAPRLTAEVRYVREPWTRRGAWAGAGGRPDAGAERRADQSGGGVARCGGGAGVARVCVRRREQVSEAAAGGGDHAARLAAATRERAQEP